MTSPKSRDVKEIRFHPESVSDDLQGSLPPKVLEVALQRLTAIQNGVRLPDTHNRALIRNLPGVWELRIQHDGSAYRIYHIPEFKEAIYLIEVQRKDSTNGGNIPKGDVERLLTRYKGVRVQYGIESGALERRYAEREARRRQPNRRSPECPRHTPSTPSSP